MSKQSGDDAPASSSRQARPGMTALMVGLVIAATCAAYSNSLHGPFIFDDIGCITDNASIRHLWPPGPVLFPPSEGGRTVAGRPIVNLSLAVNYAVSGLDVRGYHALNLLIHLAAALALWAVIRRTLQRLTGPVRDSADRLATAAALLWAVHPLTTQAVTYVIQRAESLMALCYLLTLYCVIRSSESRRRAWQIAAVLACAAGMATKEVMATAPLIVLLYDRTFLAGSFRRALSVRRFLYAGLAATWLILILLHGGRGASAGFGGPIGPREYGLTSLRFVVQYLSLAFWPHPLIFDYGTPLVHSASEVWTQAAILAGLLIATALTFRKNPAIAFLGACIFIILTPSSSFIPVSTQTAAEHRMYLPLAALVTLVVLVVYQCARAALSGRSGRLASATAVMLAALCLGSVTFHRNEAYASWLTIWSDTIARVPDNPRAYHNVSLHYFRAGQFREAIDASSQVVRLQPDFLDGYLNLANSEAAVGLHEQALADFGRAIQVAPRSATGYFNRGNSYFALGRFGAAIDDYNAAIARDPHQAPVFYSRGLGEERLHRSGEAIRSLSEAIRLKGDYDAAISERALLYCLAKEYDKAWADVRSYQKLGKTPSPQFMERLRRASPEPAQ